MDSLMGLYTIPGQIGAPSSSSKAPLCPHLTTGNTTRAPFVPKDTLFSCSPRPWPQPALTPCPKSSDTLTHTLLSWDGGCALLLERGKGSPSCPFPYHIQGSELALPPSGFTALQGLSSRPGRAEAGPEEEHCLHLREATSAGKALCCISSEDAPELGWADCPPPGIPCLGHRPHSGSTGAGRPRQHAEAGPSENWSRGGGAGESGPALGCHSDPAGRPWPEGPDLALLAGPGNQLCALLVGWFFKGCSCSRGTAGLPYGGQRRGAEPPASRAIQSSCPLC